MSSSGLAALGPPLARGWAAPFALGAVPAGIPCPEGVFALAVGDGSGSTGASDRAGGATSTTARAGALACTGGGGAMADDATVRDGLAGFA
jgi:hypothetical protein